MAGCNPGAPANGLWNRIINCNEISSAFRPNDIPISVDRRAESVQAKIARNQKENITVIASVTARGGKNLVAIHTDEKGDAL
jgi:threonyl-tRNA synthetase